jgi:pimeloyl-ACP methyl ester carboxylesterase
MPDPRVQTVIEHWMPRFVAQGVDVNDFLRTTARIERWEQWLEAWCEAGDTHWTLAREAEARGRSRTAGEAYGRAALCYHFAQFLWLVDPERRRAAHRRAVEALYAAHRYLDPTAERVEVPFEGARLAGNLRRPPGVERPPLVLLLPGLDSAKEEFFTWEEVFLIRGMATFSLDGPGQGEARESTTIRPDYEVAVTAALDALAGRTDLNLERVGVAGVSLGGYYALRSAAFEPRIRAVASISGPYDFGACWNGLPVLTREVFIAHAGARDETEGRRRAAELTLRGILHRVRQPALAIFGRQDRLIPWTQAEQMAAELPCGEVVIYPEGNHVCNNIPYKYRPLVADWMWEVLNAT